MNPEPENLGLDLPLAGIVPAAAADPVPVIPVAGALRFCNRCGTPFEPAWDDCQACAARVSRAATLAPHGSKISPLPSIALYFTLLGATLSGMVFIAAGNEATSVIVGLSVVHSAIVLAWTLGYRREVAATLTRSVAPPWFAAAAGMAFVTFLAAMGSLHVLHVFLGVQKLPQTPSFFGRGYGWPAVVLLICVQPAVFEELGFRGVMFAVLGRALEQNEVILVTALMFMTLHLMVASFPHLLLMGLAFGFLRARTGSVLPGMVMHFAHNFLVVLSERFHLW